ncbi:MauE/DoxX family redox-associated membrane protein [Microbispora sp. NPDC046973]|uniref:MauE/DoxX family redox-associated membrane protein n=1 Tax=Microbispora sp. NPDC046973 TaxID=3155022 RepID=UPI00341149BD
MLTLRLVLMGVFLVSVLTKLRTRQAFGEFTMAARRLGGLPATLGTPAAAVVVAVEAGTVVMLAAPGLDGDGRAGLLLAGGLLLAFALVLLAALRRGTADPCRCFGGSDQPISRRHVARNAVLVVGAVAGAAMTSTMGGTPVTLPAAALCLLAASVATGAVVLLDDLADLFR